MLSYPPPRIFQWDITSACNLKCRHCRASEMTHEINYPDLELAKKILDDLYELTGGKIIMALCGGEPLLYPHLLKVVSLFKEKFQNGHIEILSNATLVENNISQIAQLIDGFNISLDGACANIHDAIRGKRAFDRTLQGIEVIQNIGIPITIRMTYFNQEPDEPLKLMRLCHNLGINSFNFRYAVPVGRARNSAFTIDPKLHQSLCSEIWTVGQELSLVVGYSDPFPGLFFDPKRQEEIRTEPELFEGVHISGCSASFSLLYLDPKGKVRLCPYLPLEVGDIRKNSLSEIWQNSPVLQKFRFSRFHLKGKCKDCIFKFACGGCRGAAWGATGDYLQEDPRCWYQPT